MNNDVEADYTSIHEMKFYFVLALQYHYPLPKLQITTNLSLTQYMLTNK